MRKLPYDVQRNMLMFATAVDFRNAVERMLLKHGRLLEPDYVWWGFGGHSPRRPRGGDDGLAGSRVPLRPVGGAGGATAELEPPIPAGDWIEP